MSFSKVFILTIVFIFLGIPLVAQTNDVTPPCSLATLKGGYGGLDKATVVVQLPGFPTPPFQEALTQVVTYDGAGHFSGTGVAASFGGLIVPGPIPFTGTYTVSRNCIYTDEWVIPGIGNFHHAGTITGQGRSQEIRYIDTDDGIIGTGTAKKR